MIYETLTFIVMGNKNKALLDLFIDEGEDKESFEWEDITEEYQQEESVDFSKLSLNEIKDNVNKKYNKNIPVIPYQKKEILNDRDIAIYLNKKGNFLSLNRFKVNHLYINYKISADQDSFLTKNKKCLNNIPKRNIDFYNMGDINVNSQLKKYDIYHSSKNKLNLGDKNKLKDYILNEYANIFSIYDDFKIFELSLVDFCLYSAVESFYPDFYFTHDGKLKIIYSKDVNKMVENVKVFIEDVNRAPDKENFTMYGYSE